MTEVNDDSRNEGTPDYDFEVAEAQFGNNSLAGVALEGFGLRASYPAYSGVEKNKVSVRQWAGEPNV